MTEDLTPNLDNIRAWIAALRSGEYTQGQRRLRVGDTYCCLGVACDISQTGKWYIHEDYSAEFGGDSIYSYSNQQESAFLPDVVEQWLGADVVKDVYNVHRKHLTTLNDADRLTFSQIADVLEEIYLPEEAKV